MSSVSCPEYGDLQDKLHRLEADRESLSLQVSQSLIVPVAMELFLSFYVFYVCIFSI